MGISSSQAPIYHLHDGSLSPNIHYFQYVFLFDFITIFWLIWCSILKPPPSCLFSSPSSYLFLSQLSLFSSSFLFPSFSNNFFEGNKRLLPWTIPRLQRVFLLFSPSGIAPPTPITVTFASPSLEELQTDFPLTLLLFSLSLLDSLFQTKNPFLYFFSKLDEQLLYICLPFIAFLFFFPLLLHQRRYFIYNIFSIVPRLTP